MEFTWNKREKHDGTCRNKAGRMMDLVGIKREG